jgi:type IV pilus assembly protein PilN
MFNLEINFLKDRQLAEDLKSPSSKGPKLTFKLGEQAPLLIGIGVMALSLTVAGGFSWFVNGQAEESQNNIQKLDQELTALKADKTSIGTVQQELTKTKEESQAIVNVFGQVQSISAILQDLSDQMPKGLSVNSIEQADGPATPETGGVPVTQLRLSGVAKDFDSVNDFLLTLKKSSFLNREKTKIETAEQIDADGTFLKPKNLPKGIFWKQEKNTLTVKTPKEVITVKLPEKEVKYTISSESQIIPGNQLLQELQKKGASGLVTRLKTLKKEGLIKP